MELIDAIYTDKKEKKKKKKAMREIELMNNRLL
jgi:hypothetical protein